MIAVSPWASGGLASAGVTLDDLRARIPSGADFTAQVPHRRHGNRRGPYRFTLSLPEKPTRLEVASRIEDIPDALDRLFAPEDRLADELRASLAERGISA